MSFNKETKIGLAVILSLLVVFSVALVWRITRSNGPDAASAVERDVAVKTLDTPQAEAKSPGPTLLSPAAPFGQLARSPESASQWSAAGASEKQASSGEAARTAETPLPYSANAIPSPPTATAEDDRYQRSGDVRQAAAALVPPAAGQAEASASGESAAATRAMSESQTDGRAPQVVQGNDALQALQPPLAADSASASTFQREPRFVTPAPTPASRTMRHRIVASDAPAINGQAASTGGGEAQDSGSAYAAPAPGYSTGMAPAGLGAAAASVDGLGATPPNQFAPEPSRGEDGTYEVQPNDTFWTIAKRVYGSGAYFKALAEHNRGKVASMDRLAPGMVISVPTAAQLEQTYRDLCPRPNHREAVRTRAPSAVSAAGFQSGARIYVVQEGDTLFDIARHELGKAARWAEIYELNRDTLGKDFDYLTPGLQLAMPAKEGREAVDRTARGRGTVLER